MPNSSEKPSASAASPADSNPAGIQSLSDQLSDIQAEAKKSKVKLPPEVKEYIRTHLEKIQAKLANGEPVLEKDLEFMEDVRNFIKLLSALEPRFAKNPGHYKRPEGIDFAEVKKVIWANPEIARSLLYMQKTGGEPDIIAVEKYAFVFADCSAESPSGRRDLTYDQAEAQAKKFGVDMLSPKAYKAMQEEIGQFDKNTWIWLATPNDIRESGDALSGCRRYGGVNVDEYNAGYHVPYSGWRGLLRVPRI